MCYHHSLFIDSLNEGHQDSFEVLQITNEVSAKLMCKILCEYIFNSFGHLKIPRLASEEDDI